MIDNMSQQNSPFHSSGASVLIPVWKTGERDEGKLVFVFCFFLLVVISHQDGEAQHDETRMKEGGKRETDTGDWMLRGQASRQTDSKAERAKGRRGKDKETECRRMKTEMRMELGMEGGEKHSLWQDTQTCACQNKTSRSTRRKSTGKTKRRGARMWNSNFPTSFLYKCVRRLSIFREANGGLTTAFTTEMNKTFNKHASLLPVFQSVTMQIWKNEIALV